MQAIRLADRGVIEVTGADAAKFLHGLLTNDISSVERGKARYAALLTPQGKILFDFLVFSVDARRFLLDCPLTLADDLAKRLSLYKLRADVTIANRSGELTALAFLDEAARPEINALALARDPRSAALGWRAIVARGAAAADDDAPLEARRIASGVPKGGVDFDYGGTFPHEANMDLLNGVDFNKGCYVGQEVVSRMKHRGTVRKRVARYHARGAAPAPGETIRAGDIEIGVTGSRAGSDGLAMVRLDRLADARAKGATPMAGDVALEFDGEKSAY
ncbi:MAG: folate-binding protein [Methylocystis sp.]|nr:folate-binding protein [Methylocystis sp.]